MLCTSEPFDERLETGSPQVLEAQPAPGVFKHDRLMPQGYVAPGRRLTKNDLAWKAFRSQAGIGLDLLVRRYSTRVLVTAVSTLRCQKY